MSGLTSLPHIAITIGRATLDDASVACLEHARIARALSLPAQCALRFHLGLGRHPDLRRIDPGDPIEVRVDAQKVFVGKVGAVEVQLGADAATRLFIRAYDALHELRRRQIREGRADATVKDIIGEVFSGGVDGDPGPPHGVVAGQGHDALTVASQHAARLGRYLVADDDRIRIVTLDGYGSPSELRHGHGVHELAVDRNADEGIDAVVGTSWVAATGEQLRASATVDGGPGAGWEAERIRHGLPASTQAELDAMVNADARRSHERAIVVRALAEGSPDLVPGRRIVVRAVPGFDGHVATITESTHTINEEGYRVAISTQPPARREDEARTHVTLGIVDDVADPQHRGRIRVVLPEYEGAKTDWSPVLMPGVGPGSGFVALPDRGAQVVVALGRGDPSDCVVLGATYGPTAADDDGISGGRARRYVMQLPSGLKLTLDDENEMARLEHPNGGAITLAGDGVSIVATTPLRIDATGQPVEIKAKSVDFVEAG